MLLSRLRAPSAAVRRRRETTSGRAAAIAPDSCSIRRKRSSSSSSSSIVILRRSTSEGAGSAVASPAPTAATNAAAETTASPSPAAAETTQPSTLPVVHVPFRWPAQLGATRVSVFGSWDGWKQRAPLAKSPVTGDFVRVLALPLDPRGADGAAVASSSAGGERQPLHARQIEYKFEVEYEYDGVEVEDEEGVAGGGDTGRPSNTATAKAGKTTATTTKSRRARVAVRPAPSDPIIRTAAPVFASEVFSGGAGSSSSSGGNSSSRTSSTNSTTCRCWTESHANNKRLLAPNKLFVLPPGCASSSSQDEVLAISDYGGWHAAIPLTWNAAAGRHEAAAALPPGLALSYRFLVNGRPALGAPTIGGGGGNGGASLMLPPLAPAPPPAPAGRLAHRDAALPPPRAFTLFYATGWPSATLVYRFRLPRSSASSSASAAAAAGLRASAAGPATITTPWQHLAMDVAPSRDAPNGGRWMTAVVEPPPHLRRDPGSLEARAEAEAEAQAKAWGGGGARGNGSSSAIDVSTRVAALAAAPPQACELEFFVRGPPVAPPPPDDDASSSNNNENNAALAAPCPRHPEEDRGPNGGARQHYLLPAPMAWKLSRGAVSKFPRALRPPCMLVSDLDHTLYAEGEASAQALARFTAYWESEAALARSVLVYNTGRSLGQFVALVNEQRGRLALPDVLVTAVGTKVFHLKAEWRAGGHGAGGGGYGASSSSPSSSSNASSSNYHSSAYPTSSLYPHAVVVTEDDWQEDLAWARRLDRRWDLGRARGVAERAIAAARSRFSRGFSSSFEGDPQQGQQHLPGDQIVNWLDDGSEHPHRVAVSCHVKATPFVAASLRQGMAAAGVEARVIVSGAGDWRYVDAVARRAGKAAALEHVRRLYGVAPERTMAAGDSCNDVLMLAAAADGGMREALAAPLAHAAAAQARRRQQRDDEEGDGGNGPHGGAAAAAMLMMRDYWAGGGARSFLDEASDLSSGGGGENDDGRAAAVVSSTTDDDEANEAGNEGDEDDEEEDGDGGRAPRVKAVIVGNAQRELVEWYNGQLKEDTGCESILLARQTLADGVLEGLMRHGLY